MTSTFTNSIARRWALLRWRMPHVRWWIWNRRHKPIPTWAQPKFRAVHMGAWEPLDAEHKTRVERTCYCWTPVGKWLAERRFAREARNAV